jgi:hypothetical protein
MRVFAYEISSGWIEKLHFEVYNVRVSPNIITAIKWRRVELAECGGRLRLREMPSKFERET